MVWLLAFTLRAGEPAEAQLPPPTAAQVDFERDIKPLLDTACLRCHGPERAKSGFRLDSRRTALRGGEHGIDIVAGDSAKSPLIRYVAGLVPDLEMPPEGKGEPLTPEQIGLLRAWIDQGVAWTDAVPTNRLDAQISPFVAAQSAGGDTRRFSEHYWQPDGLNGGVERFDFQRIIDADTRLTAAGHAWLNDYQLKVDLDRKEVGFIHSGWEQYRKYYDGLGGRDAAIGLAHPERLDQDLHLDTGKAWIDFGLTLPGWPRLVLGYEYDYLHGQEAITSWSAMGSGGGLRNLAPASKHLEEGTHVVRFDFDAEVKDIKIEDRFRGEFYSHDTAYTNLAARGALSQDVRDRNHYFQGANSLRFEKQLKPWLYGSAGYFYSHLDGDDSFTDSSVSGGSVFLAAVPRVTLSRDSHVLNLAGLLGPFGGLTLSASVQSEWTRQEAAGAGNLNGLAYSLPPGSNLALSPAVFASVYDQQTTSERVGLRYTKIPFTTLFADARLEQETIDQTDSELQPGASFMDNPSFFSRASDLRAGFASSPWEKVTLSGHYRRYENDSHYPTNQPSLPAGGYPGFLASRSWATDEFEAKLVVRPARWLKTSLTYQFVTSDFDQDTRAAYPTGGGSQNTPGGPLLAGKYDSQVISLGVTITPLRRLSFTTTLSYQQSRSATASVGLLPPYQGDVYSLLASGTYLLDNATDLTLSYSVSLADYSQDFAPPNPESPPSVGIRYQQHAAQALLTRRFSSRLSARLQYGYYLYAEPSAGGAADYRVHTIMAALTYRFR